MATITVLCPTCQGDAVVKFGKSPEGKQRYRCRNEKCEKNTFLFDYTYKDASVASQSSQWVVVIHRSL